MGIIPSWIVRWGITVIAAVFVLILIGCCVIKFPQTISATISISSINPPAKLEARYAGIIDTIAITNGQSVQQGELIALLKTPAIYGDVQRVKAFAELATSGSLSELAFDPIFKTKLDLGDLQVKWTELLSLYQEYMQHQNLDQIGQKRNLLLEQISENHKYNEVLHRQLGVMKTDVELQLLAMQRDSVLWKGGSISQSEYEASQQVYLSKLNGLISLEASIKSADLDRVTLEHGLKELDIERRVEADAFQLRFSRIAAELRAQIADWVEKYAIVAPFDGFVSLQDHWGMGQHADVGDVLANVLPNSDSTIEGRMKVSSVGFGRIAQGQTVNVFLNGFPYVEFGILKGEIARISRVPEKHPDGSIYYNVEVSFPQGLVTVYNKSLPLIQDMDGKAEIVTRDQRLIEHFIEPIISSFRNR